jgi:hypothetical protein
MIMKALNRTFLLMRTDLVPGVDDEALLDALRSTRVVIAADESTLSTHSGQSAYVTAATLMARSGHSVWLAAPEVGLIGAQPPLRGEKLMAGLRDLGEDLLPQWSFEDGPLPKKADLTLIFGDPVLEPPSGAILFANASDWSGRLSGHPEVWKGESWPVGGLVAAVLGAGEAFKAAMRRLRAVAASPSLFDELYADVESIEIELAPAGTPTVSALGRFDMISAGAIGNALFHVLLRLPGVSGSARVLDDDQSALSNLNRNSLLRRSRLERPKVEDVEAYANGLLISPVPHRFGTGTGEEVDLGDIVLVGVDHIPSRWAAQRTRPLWLGIGATERFAVQVSFHEEGLACAQCLHPNDAPLDGDIPTAAFVSYWAGLLLAVEFLRFLSGDQRSADRQQAYFPTLRPESWLLAHSAVAPRAGCPTCVQWRSLAAE